MYSIAVCLSLSLDLSISLPAAYTMKLVHDIKVRK